jgi:hypothetical protein
MSTARLPADPADADPARAADDNAPDEAGISTHLPLPDQAWQRFCRGQSISAIARALNLDRHTVARSLKQVHDETLAERRAERTRALTQAFGALQQIQAAAWDQLALDQAHERLVWDRYLRATAQPAAEDSPEDGTRGAGTAVRPPTFHPQTARLLTLILGAVREVARLEFLDDPAAPSRAGDTPEDQPKDAY